MVMAPAGSKPLTNARQEMFVQGILKGLPANRAYVAAGYADKNADSNATRLMGNERVAARVQYLQSKVADKVVAQAAWTKERVIARLEQNIDLAEQLEMPQAINTSLGMIGKEIGMFVERKEVKVDLNRPLEERSEAELLAYAEQLRREEQKK